MKTEKVIEATKRGAITIGTTIYATHAANMYTTTLNAGQITLIAGTTIAGLVWTTDAIARYNTKKKKVELK